MLNAYSMLDDALANELGVTTEEYIRKIEKTTKKRAEVIVFGLMEEDSNKIEKIKRIFKLIV